MVPWERANPRRGAKHAAEARSDAGRHHGRAPGAPAKEMSEAKGSVSRLLLSSPGNQVCAAYERLELWLHRQAAGELNRRFGQPFDLDQSPLRIGQELDYLDGPDFQRFWDTDGGAHRRGGEGDRAARLSPDCRAIRATSSRISIKLPAHEYQ
jgi:hypothetical protein